MIYVHITLYQFTNLETYIGACALHFCALENPGKGG